MIGVGAGLALMLLTSGQATAATVLLQKPLPDVPDPDNPSFEVFHRLSLWVTCRGELDEELSHRVYKIFQEEPWGKQHISRSFLGLKEALTTASPQATIPQLIRDKVLGEGETWFVSHLLMTWYLGVYYHERTEPLRVTHTGALMWDAIEDITGVPGLTGGETGFWAARPQPQNQAGPL